MIRTYLELSTISTFEDRYNYLQLKGFVGEETFGFDRYMNQNFYRSQEWKSIRNFVIVRDNGCDLGMKGYEIHGMILIHHMNPISRGDIENQSDILLNPNFLISATQNTHRAIHYGDINQLPKKPIERRPNDTCPWRH